MGAFRLPLQAQLAAPDRGDYRDDVIAGLITAVLLVPQGMAYALLAGLPAQTGLYAAILPPVVYALFGTSRTLAVGPVAVAALMVASALNAHVGDSSVARVTGAMVLAMEVGVILLLLGVLRAGALVNFISHPVLSGFTTGAALLIIITQLKHFTGVSVQGDDALALLSSLLAQRDEFGVLPALVGVATLLLLLLGRRPMVALLVKVGVARYWAAMLSRIVPLLAVVIGAALSAALLTGRLSVVGDIPVGIPVLHLEIVADGSLWYALAPSALLIAVVAYVESVSVAKALAARRRQRLHSNQEFHALGAANIAAALISAMPVAGGFARSMVNFDAGARTQLATIIAASMVLLATLFFTAALYHLPNVVLAAIIVVAVAQLIDLRGGLKLWRYSRGDGSAFVATALGVLLLGVEAGLVIGIILSLGIYVWRTGKPHIAVVGRVPGTTHFRNIYRHKVAQLPQVIFVRPDADIYFANAAAVEDYLMREISASIDVHHVVLIMTAVNYIDSTGLDMLEGLEEELARAGVTLCLCEVKGPVMDRLQGTALGRALRHDRVFLSTEKAWATLASAAARRRQKQEKYDTWVI